jgi:hypothetical protein
VREKKFPIKNPFGVREGKKKDQLKLTTLCAQNMEE